MNAQAQTWIEKHRSRRDTRYAAKLQQDRYTVLRRRPARRGIVAASILLLAVAVALLWWGTPGGAQDVDDAAYLAAGLAAVGGFTVLRFTVRAHWPERALDERLVAVRNAAYRTSYRILAVGTGLVLLALSLAWAAAGDSFVPEPHQLRAVLLAFVGAAVMLPAAVLAWRERSV